VAAPPAATAAASPAPPPRAAIQQAPVAAAAADAVPQSPGKRWLVQRGDTLTRACRETYGICDPAQLREIFAYNPKIDAKGTIRPGEIVVLPAQADAPKPN
jgi:nucleoid-associated protein YgaU